MQSLFESNLEFGEDIENEMTNNDKGIIKPKVIDEEEKQVDDAEEQKESNSEIIDDNENNTKEIINSKTNADSIERNVTIKD